MHEEEKEPKPVPNPDLPEEGDPEDLEPEPVVDSQFEDIGEKGEQLEEPNDLSGIEKEFDD